MTTAINKDKGASLDSTSTFKETPEAAKKFKDKFDCLLAKSLGSKATITTTKGTKYKGVLVAANLEGNDGLDVVLKSPEMITPNENDNGQALGETLLVHADDVAQLKIADLNISEVKKPSYAAAAAASVPKKAPTPAKKIIPAPAPAPAASKPGFRTDVDISGGKNVRERKLQRWAPDESDAGTFDPNTNAGQTLEEASSSWDQFSVNEKKFGVKSTYDEHFYTTRINKSDPNYQQRLKEAQRIADEIEKQGTSGNVHLAEDRGIVVDDSGMDEEDLYSGVDRRGDELLASLKTNAKPSAAANPNKYVPPTLRNQPHHMDPAIISSSGAKNVTPANGNKTRATLKNADEETKKQLKEIKRQSGRGEHDRIKAKAQAQNGPKVSKEEQIEELKNFAQKFKVPYDVPKDMGDVLRKTEVPLKDEPSLPPKPKTSAQSSHASRSGTAGKHTSTAAGNDGKRSAHGQHNHSGNNAPSRGGNTTATHSRKRQSGSFFGSKKPMNNGAKKETFSRGFNLFIKAKEDHDAEKSMEPFLIEKPYFAAPTWSSTIEQSHKTLFPDIQTIFQESQAKMQMRQMSAMGGMPPNMGANGVPQYPGAMMGGNAAGPNGGATSPNPMMGGFQGNGGYMPFQPQPMFYPGMAPMGPMMGGGKDGSAGPNGSTPPPMPDQMGYAPPGAYMGMGEPYGYPMNGMPQFPGAMMGGPQGMMGGGDNNNRNYHGHGHNNHRGSRGPNKNNHNRA